MNLTPSRSVKRIHVFLLSVDCQWGQWGRWTSCTKTCGGGIQTKTRIQKHAETGGRSCLGKTFKDRHCNTKSCRTRPISIEIDSSSTSYQYYSDSINYSDYGEKSKETHEVSRSSREPDTIYLNSYEK